MVNDDTALPEHVRRNRIAWDANAPEYVAPGERAWARDEPTWGIWGVPESELRVFPEDLAGKDAIAISRKMMGATFGSKAEPGTIRGEMRVEDAIRQLRDNHLDHVFQSSRRSSGNFNRSDALVMRLRPETSLGLQTGKSCSEQRRTASSPLQLPSPCLTATSTSSRTKSI